MDPETAYQRALDSALRFLSYRPRSEQEVRRRLGRQAWPAEVIEAVVARLRAVGLLDDAAFARLWVENRQQFRPRGTRALEAELRARGVETAVARAAVAEQDEEAMAERAARAQVSRLAGLDRPTARRRLAAFLLRRGFGPAVVYPVVDRLLPPESRERVD